MRGTSHPGEARCDAIFLSCVGRHAQATEAAASAEWIPVALRYGGSGQDALRSACYERLFLMLSQHAGVGLNDFLRISRNALGKPVLPPEWGHVHFSVSHAHDYGLVAVSFAPVGVDLECVDERYHGMLAELFARSCLLRATTPFVAWVCYESIAKLLGLGLRLGVEKVQEIQGQMFAAAQPVWVREVPGPEGYVAAIACGNPQRIVRWAGVQDDGQRYSPDLPVHAHRAAIFRSIPTEQ